MSTWRLLLAARTGLRYPGAWLALALPPLLLTLVGILWTQVQLGGFESAGQAAGLFALLLKALDAPSLFFRWGLSMAALALVYGFVASLARAAAYGALSEVGAQAGLDRWGLSLLLVSLTGWLLRLALGATAWLAFREWLEPWSRWWVDERWRVVALCALGVATVLLLAFVSCWSHYCEAAAVAGNESLASLPRSGLQPLRQCPIVSTSVWGIPFILLLASKALGFGSALVAPAAIASSMTLGLANMGLRLWSMQAGLAVYRTCLHRKATTHRGPR